jgi:deoxycytidine triphosphate deaminase
MDTSSNLSPRDRERERLKQLPEIEAAQFRASSSPVSKPGVLLAKEIERCCHEFSLISPFSPNQLKAASYRLTVGSRYSLGGERRTLAESEQIRIPPFQVLVIQTRETLNMPRDMIARWNIKVSMAYKGLIWAGGPQVDPGYQGHLFCPIYNLSDQEVSLSYGTEIAVIDFVTTTAFDRDGKKFERPPQAMLFDDYDTLKSGLSDAWDRIQQFDTKITIYGGFALTLIGIIVAALSVMASSSASAEIKTLRLSEWLCLIISGVAVALAWWVGIRTQNHPRRNGVHVASALVFILVGFFLGVVVMLFALPLPNK